MPTTRNSTRKNAGVGIDFNAKAGSKITFDEDYENPEDEEELAKTNTNFEEVTGAQRKEDSESDNDGPVEEVSGSTSRRKVMEQRRIERTSKVITKKKKRRLKKIEALDILLSSDDEDAEMFRGVDNERKESTNLKMEMRQQEKTRSNQHVTFSSEYGLMDHDSQRKDVGHDIEVAISTQLTHYANKPSNIAIILSEKTGTIVDGEAPRWKRTKSKTFFRKVGSHGF